MVTGPGSDSVEESDVTQDATSPSASLALCKKSLRS